MSQALGDRKERVKAVFDRLAPDYDAARPACFAHLGRRLVDQVGVHPSDRVFDVVRGRGGTAAT